MDIFGLDLTNRRINKTPLFLRPVFYKRQMRRRKNNGTELARQLCRAFQRDLIERGGAAFFNRQKRLLFASGRIKTSFNRRLRRAEAHKLRILCAAEAFSSRTHPHCFNKVCLSLTIVAIDHIGAGTERKLQ